MAAAPSEMALHRDDAQRMGFFTDTSVCIGCKACEVACKQWNDLPADGDRRGQKGVSYDYTGALSASTWRHVRFVETVQTGSYMPTLPAPDSAEELPSLVEMAEGGPELSARLGESGGGCTGGSDPTVQNALDRWVFQSDVCKHCTNAGCLDACPTGALIRTEFETVVLQADVCNGCGYCVPEIGRASCRERV